MKKIPVVAAVLGLIAFIVPLGAWAAEGPKARIFAKYDTNKNGVIDGDEIEVVRKAFAADPKGEFAAYDRNGDGRLDEGEIAAIKPPGTKNGGGKKEGAKKKPEPAAAEGK